MTDAVRIAPLTVSVEGEVHTFSRTAVVRIGRADTNDLVIADRSVSRNHLELVHDAERRIWKAVDTGSANGVYINNLRVSEAWLNDSTEIRLGKNETDLVLTVTVGFLLTTEISPRQSSQASDVVIGKSAEANFILSDVLVSRKHARLIHVGDTLYLEDLGSTNGTFVNGQLITNQIVSEGDIITIGNTDLTIREGQLEHLRSPDDQSGGLLARDIEFTIKGGKKLLSGVDLHVPPGNLTAVIGPSGAGKSTLLRALAGITRPTSGTVEFDNFNVHESFDVVSSRIGLVPQDDVLHTTLKLKNALMYGARLRLRAEGGNAEREEQVEKVIGKLELGNNKSTRINRLSGGQRKRASVALELLTEPSLIILDEPTSGLDPAMDRQVMKTLRELADEKKGVLVVTHSVAHLDVCDDVLVLAPGGIPAYYGPPTGIQKFFSSTDWADIFEQIKSDPAAVYARYQQQLKRDFNELTESAEPSQAMESKKVRSAPWFEQFATLCQRQIALIFADIGYLFFLLTLPLMLGLLISIVPGSAGFGPASNDAVGEPSQLLAMLVIGCAFMGTSISIRDLVGERAIFLRERAVGLPVSAYLASKLFVFSIFAWFMVIALTVVTLLYKPEPIQSIIIKPAWLELMLALGLTSMSAMIIGLFISSMVRSGEQVMPLLVIVLMAQLVLNGGLLPIQGRPVITEISYLVVAKWGFSMAASGLDLEGISPNLESDPLWEHALSVWTLSAAALVTMGIVATLAARIRLDGKYDR